MFRFDQMQYIRHVCYFKIMFWLLLWNSSWVSWNCLRNIWFQIGSNSEGTSCNMVARREKTCLRGFRQSEFQTSLLSYRDKLENCNFTCSKYTYNTFQKANNEGADQTARMRRLVCACVVRKPPKTGFLASRPIWWQLFLNHLVDWAGPSRHFRDSDVFQYYRTWQPIGLS